MSLFEKAVVAHLVADWLLQNDWMARNKVSLAHPAAWVHFGIHTGLLWPILGWEAALALGLSHLLIDTRVPLRWWRKTIRQTTDGYIGELVAITSDQVVHIICLAVVILWLQ